MSLTKQKNDGITERKKPSTTSDISKTAESAPAKKSVPEYKTKERSTETDMTEGSIIRHIIVFALPLLAGNLFQQLYNMVDTWVIGNYASNEAFSAVGTVGPVINMLIGFFSGFATGAGVVISQNYGAGNLKRAQDTARTAISLTALFSILFTVVGVMMTPLMIRLMKTPADVAPEQKTYLTVYFAGFSGLMLYNMGAAILRAIGDSRRPFYYLMVCAVMNTVLDLVFVKNLGMGVFGVALATILSQFVSAILVLLALIRTKTCVRLTLHGKLIDIPITKNIIRIGIPAALQLSITAFSNVFVQSYINRFGADAMAGWTAYAKADQVMFLPMQSIALASTTFVGQNLGKKNVNRAKQGVRVSLLCAFISTVLLMVPVLFFAPQITAFFNSKTEVVYYGTLFLRWLSPFYVLCCVNQVIGGSLRGAGNSRAPMIIMLGSFVVFRQIYLFIMSRFICNEILPIAMGYPAGWLVCSAVSLLYYIKTPLDRNRLV